MGRILRLDVVYIGRFVCPWICLLSVVDITRGNCLRGKNDVSIKLPSPPSPSKTSINRLGTQGSFLVIVVVTTEQMLFLFMCLLTVFFFFFAACVVSSSYAKTA